MTSASYLLNLADLALTLYALNHGGVELNPLMQNVRFMVAYKVVGVGVGCWGLSKLASDLQVSNNARKIARAGLRLCTACYFALCLYHFYFIFGGA